ncbi:pyridoxal-phosphate-dependent aminotransferase family protein [Limobrevibacterium gyesilva]|uniref:Alanine--glyoxylate aminotransferase family protein n=1 Tax=Limobrevibacterium gyesilva TaxID=2991712 RepID=A0AA41YQJ7_9PROT|nr:alanine--glyoxylate aminotransferase family protein [Limobrevibacterium gyesilva]MCW3474655.1 alanine--glyoxylate aminotransferase family protein [Limobrevibacterium gyesilva]
MTRHDARISEVPSTYRLRLPGPTEVPERVRQAIARPVVNHRGPEFRAELARAEELLQPILGTANRILFFACSGTGMMEAALANIVSPGAALLVVAHGQFGERFAAIGRSLPAKVDVLEVPWGEAVDPAVIEARLRETEYRAVVLIHNESSTGVVSDLVAIGAVLRDHPALLVVDSVSGLGGVEMRQDEWGVDIVVSASQKALMCPPGLGLASVSAKAWRVINRDDRVGSFYWDFRRALAAAEKAETAFTAPVGLVGGLCEALAMIHEEGLPNVLERHRRLAAALRAGGTALGFGVFGSAPLLSSTVVVFTLPARSDGTQIDGGQIVRDLYDRHRTVIAGARNRLSGRVIRIGTMGAFGQGTILTDLAQLEGSLIRLGCPVTPGAGLLAANAALATGC